jgi:hypothetical protein
LTGLKIADAHAPLTPLALNDPVVGFHRDQAHLKPHAQTVGQRATGRPGLDFHDFAHFKFRI